MLYMRSMFPSPRQDGRSLQSPPLLAALGPPSMSRQTTTLAGAEVFLHPWTFFTNQRTHHPSHHMRETQSILPSEASLHLARALYLADVELPETRLPHGCRQVFSLHNQIKLRVQNKTQPAVKVWNHTVLTKQRNNENLKLPRAVQLAGTGMNTDTVAVSARR